MARSSAYRTRPQNSPYGNKDKLVVAALTKGNNTPAVPRAPIPAIAPPVVFALSSMARYSKNDLQ